MSVGESELGDVAGCNHESVSLDMQVLVFTTDFQMGNIGFSFEIEFRGLRRVIRSP